MRGSRKGTGRGLGASWFVGSACALALGPAGVARGADAPPLTVELNKLEPQAKACRAYIVIDNASDAAFQSLKIDLVFFRTDGVIDRRLLFDLAPIRPNKRSVKTFDLDNLPCEGVGSILVNDATDCRDASGPLAGCLDRLKLASRSGVTLSK